MVISNALKNQQKTIIGDPPSNAQELLMACPQEDSM